MGSTDSVRSCVGVLVHGLPEGQEALTIKLDYANGIVVSAYSVYDTLSGVPLLKWVIRPEMRISSITYYLAPPMGLDDELKIPWRGFTMGPALDYFCPR